MNKLAWTIAALTTLGTTAHAEPGEVQPAVEAFDVAGHTTGASLRDTIEDRSIAHDGGELTGSMKFIMADAMSKQGLGGEPLKFTDLALFDVAGRWSLYDHIEVAANISLLPKQPSYTDESAWQSAGGSIRVPVGRRGALEVYGGGGHLIAHQGAWTHEGGDLEYRKPVARWLNFDMKGGADVITLASQSQAQTAWLSEVGGSMTLQVHDPFDHMFGGWFGIAYMVPVSHKGIDPTTKMGLDPQPRLDVHFGSAIAVTKDWDIFADLGIIDRGDIANPQTRLPILDGGFDQAQFMVGITRHIDPPKRADGPDEGVALE
ncbi:MAG: hypothetical protein QM831_16780 [Kofleriaceae bacterium]